MSWGLLGGLGKGIASAGSVYGEATAKAAMSEIEHDRETQRGQALEAIRHRYAMELEANKSQLVNDRWGGVNLVRGETATPVMIGTKQPYQMPEGSYFDEEDRQQAEGGLLSVSRKQLNVGEDKGRFRTFEHPTLGWVQEDGEGKLHQFDPDKMPGGAGGLGSMSNKDMHSKVELKNGQVVTEGVLQSEYEKTYGKYDAIMQKYVLTGDEAMTFNEFRNAQVKPQYVRDLSERWGGPEPQGQPQPGQPQNAESNHPFLSSIQKMPPEKQGLYASAINAINNGRDPRGVMNVLRENGEDTTQFEEFLTSFTAQQGAPMEGQAAPKSTNPQTKRNAAEGIIAELGNTKALGLLSTYGEAKEGRLDKNFDEFFRDWQSHRQKLSPSEQAQVLQYILDNASEGSRSKNQANALLGTVQRQQTGVN